MLPDDLPTVTRFDAFLDALATEQSTRPLTSDLDSDLVATTRRVHAALIAPTPDPTFARELRRSFLSRPTKEDQVMRRVSVLGFALNGPISSWKRGRWLPRLELSAMSAIIAVLLLVVTSQGQLPSWLDTRTPESRPIGITGLSASTSTDPTVSILTATTTPIGVDVAPTDDEAHYASSMFVVITSGDVRMRSEPSTDASIVATFDEGTELVVIDGPDEGDGHVWWHVRDDTNGNEGWVVEDWLGPARVEQTESDDARVSTGQPPFLIGDSVQTNGSATIYQEPSQSSISIFTVPDQTTVILTGPAVWDGTKRWWPVEVAIPGERGFILESYLQPSSGSGVQPTVTPVIDPTTPTSSDAARWTVGASLVTNESGLNLRDAPSFAAPIVTTMPIGTALTMIAEPTTIDGLTWVPIKVVASGDMGYVLQDNLSAPTDQSTKPDLGNGLKVKTTRSAALHEGPDPLSPVVATVPESVVLSTTGRAIWDGDGRWWPVRVLSSGPNGYMLESFLEPAGPNQDNNQPTVTINVASTPTDTPSSSRFAVGATVYVASDRVVMREGPAFDRAEVTTLNRGTPLSVLGASVTTQGVVWWPVGDITTGLTGYVVEEGLTDTHATSTPTVQSGFVDTDSQVELSVMIDADGLLAGASAAKDDAIAALQDALTPYATCRVGFVQTFGYSTDIAEGIRIADSVNALLRDEFSDMFEYAVVDSFASVGSGRGQVEIMLYFYRGCAQFTSATPTVTLPRVNTPASPLAVRSTPIVSGTATPLSADTESVPIGELPPATSTPTQTPNQ